jgi:predicted TIM-barrel fold metal-dependent hydrolase
LIYLPFHDPEACIKTVDYFTGKPGVIGFMVNSTHHRIVFENDYIKLYAMLQERGYPLAFHSATGSEAGLRLFNKFFGVHALGFCWHNMVYLTNWIISAMPERFPKLKTIWIESGLAWVPFLMQRLDNEYMMRSSEVPLLKRKPSDYMREMYFSTQPMEMVDNREALELTFKLVNAESQLLYASDFPHWDMDLPSTIYDLPFVSEQGKRDILGGNAQRLFNLEPVWSPQKLARRAARN